jgi:hypothetical protein
MGYEANDGDLVLIHIMRYPLMLVASAKNLWRVSLTVCSTTTVLDAVDSPPLPHPLSQSHKDACK